MSSDWQVPSMFAAEKDKLGWLNEAVAEGQLWLRSQRGYTDYQAALEIISGRESGTKPAYRSKLTGNRLKTNIRVAIAGLSNVRPLWGYHSENKAYQPMAGMLNKLNRALYLEGQWGADVKSVLQWAAATNTGFMRPVYTRGQGGWGRGRIELKTYGSPSVLPVQMPADGNWQEAYAVHLMDEMPIWQAHAKFPDHQDRLKPTSSRYWYSAEIRAAAKQNTERSGWNPFRRRQTEGLSELYIPLRYTTINDLAINQTGKPIPMGQPDSPWYYVVPPYDPDGAITGKVVDANAARMYPYRRLIISSESCVLYDGPSFNWHGELDLIPFCLDRWPWEPEGFGMVHDSIEMQKALDGLDRGIMDRINARQNLPLAYNMDSVSKREAEQFDPMQPRARVAFDANAGDKPFTTPVPHEIYAVDATDLEWRKELQAGLDYTLQSRDIVELGKARALGKGMDQLEALISADGPIVKDMSESITMSLCRVGHQLMYLELEYLPTGRVMQYVGADGVTLETFDYDPGALVPSHMPGESPVDSSDKPVPSSYPAMVRARHLAENIKFQLTDAHELKLMTQRLLYLQLRGRGLPISSATIMQSCDVPNVEIPAGQTEQERFYAEQEEDLVHKAKVANIMKYLAIEYGLQDLAGGGGGKPNGSTPKGGRPPSGKQAPTLQKKGDGRSVISESG